MTLRFGVFDHIEPVPGLGLDRIYRERLIQIERLDASGKILGSTTIWVLGGVPVNGRAYFSASVPDATSYRVQVLSFDWTGLGT